ncbi:maleylpyruvate isomerase N-terminal domain-containing protein [Solwaraspora sp. WMMD792]|uniref:maleylpyruvate isomerase N-terminal domain-containing protein n=1 Tax=Solwaraspora sp. WMMD792 TaxID=3016099 RepID=UPI0024176454|nr:maleylpyruvate isomerase N-terminal domain-containing protein [Solwaraspora sp. WMMD792]MDG4770498.1 maleylpyruvate isomerase N-terminal domain-containing protein [Solwaraspora sp. WMMD792]
MSYVVPAQRWTLARTALRLSSDRFRSLLTVDSDPTAMATRDWTVADSAAHVLSIAMLYVTLVEDTGPPLPVPDIGALLAAANVDTVADVNDHVLRHFPERDPGRLADLLDEATDTILSVTAQLPPETTVRWLGDARVTVCGLLAHLVNELVVHGWDMARAMRRPWPMPDEHAALYWDQFFLGMLQHDYGVLLNTSGPMPKRPIAVRFSSAYTPSATIVLDDRRVRLAAPDDPVDVRVRFRPARFNLMLFGRTSTAVAALRRDVVIGGPRPWRLPAFLRVVHMPNARLAPAGR